MRGILGQMVEPPAIGLEHRIDHALREQVVDHDPVEFQRALADHHLVVEPDLGRAGVEEFRLAEQVRATDQQVEIHAQEAGEHDRHQAAGVHAAAVLRAVAGQFAQDFHAAEARVRQAGPELGLGGGGTLGEGQRRVAVDREQQHRGEIADQPLDIRMHAAAIEVREVEREAAIAGPAREHFRERGEQHGRAGQPGLGGKGRQPLPRLWVEAMLQAPECRPRHVGRHARERQPRGRRDLGQAGLPPGLVGQIGCFACGVPAGQQVVPETEADGGQLRGRVAVAALELGQQDVEALHVEHQQVEIEVQAGHAGRLARGAQVEQRPALGVEHLPAHAGAFLREPGRHAIGRLRAQVFGLDGVVRHGAEDALPPIRRQHGAHHAVPRHDPVPGLLEALQVQVWRDPLEVDVA